MAGDGNVIDSLSIQISANVSRSINAIDSLQEKLVKLNGALNNYSATGTYAKALQGMSEGFEALTVAINDLDYEKVDKTAKSLGNLAKAASTMQDAFSSSASGGQSSSISKATLQLREYGKEIANQQWIKSKEGIEAVSEAFENYARKLSLFGEEAQATKLALEQLSWISKSFARLDAFDSSLDFPDARAVRDTLSTSSKIYMSDSVSQAENYAQMRNVLGKAFSKSISKDHQDWENFVSEMNQTLGTGFADTANYTALEQVASFVTDLDGKVKRLSEAEVDWAHQTSFVEEVINDVIPDLQKLAAIAGETYAELNGKGASNSESTNGFVSLANSLHSIEGVTLPDLTALTPLVDAVKKIGNDKGELASANLVKIGEALKTFDGTLHLPEVSSLAELITAIRKLGNKSETNGTENLPKIAAGLKSFAGVSIPDVSGLNAVATLISSLGNAASVRGAENIPKISEFLTQLSFVQIPNLEGVDKLALAIKELGSSNAKKAAENLPVLTASLNELMVSLGSLPDVSENTIKLIEALGNLDAKNLKVADSSNQVSKSVHGVSAASVIAKRAFTAFVAPFKTAWQHTNTFNSGLKLAERSIKSFSTTVSGTVKSTLNIKSLFGRLKESVGSLGVAFIKLRGIVWGFKTVASMFSSVMESASSLTEVQNVVQHVYDPGFLEEFNEASTNTIQTLGLSKLSFQQFASRYQAMGRALGITNGQMSEAEDHLKSMGVEYGTMSGKMGDMSVNLTRLAGDMASFYDVDVDSVYKSLQAVYTGQTRPLNIAA